MFTFESVMSQRGSGDLMKGDSLFLEEISSNKILIIICEGLGPQTNDSFNMKVLSSGRVLRIW